MSHSSATSIVDTKIDVIILCGGYGERFRGATNDTIPKSLYRLHGKELIRYTLDTLDPSTTGTVIFATGHHANMMRDWVANQQFPYDIVVTEQTTPGIVGAVRSARPHVTSPYFMLCNSDEVRDGFNAADYIHRSLLVADDSHGTMATAQCDNLYRHRVISVNDQNCIVDSQLRGEQYLSSPTDRAIVNAGIILMPSKHLDELDRLDGTDWSAIIDPLIAARRLYSVITHGMVYFNVGTTDELSEADAYFANA